MNEPLSWSVVIAFIIFIAQQVFKTWLDYRKYRSEVVFSKLHQERAEVVKQIFQKLTILHQTLFDFTRAAQFIDGKETYEEHQQKLFMLFNKAYVDARNYTSLNSIYLTNDLYTKIDILISELRNSAIDYNYLDNDIREAMKIRDTLFLKEKRVQCRSIGDKVEVTMSRLLKDLESEFRNLLGAK